MQPDPTTGSWTPVVDEGGTPGGFPAARCAPRRWFPTGPPASQEGNAP